MSDGTYQTKVYERQGGDAVVVASGGKVVVETGGAIVGDNEAQSGAIASVATAGAATAAANADAINAILVALRNVGIIAS